MAEAPAGVRDRQALRQRAGLPDTEDSVIRRGRLSRNALIAGAAAFIVSLLASHFRSTPYNNYVLLADAFLHGHAWITWPGAYIDALAYNGQHYVIEAPVPALLLLPYVAVAGLAANQTVLACILAGIGIGAAWRIGERTGISVSNNAWLCAFLLAGTDYLWCAMLGDVWFIAHVAAACFTLLALAELLGNRRGCLVALWAVCAAGSRFTMVLAIPVYAAMLAAPDWKSQLRTIGAFSGVLACAAAAWIAYNYARWGVPSDIGYTTWYHQDQAGMPTGSPFRLQYLKYEVWSFFVQWPDFSAAWPWVRPSYSGVALTWTSPALIYAFFARKPIPLVAAMWAAVVLTAVPNLVYYVNGFAQYGMRHALDFIPFLFVLMALASRDRIAVWARALIIYSCIASLYGVWYWNASVRPGN